MNIRERIWQPAGIEGKNHESESFLVLPTHGDGHYLGTEEGARPVDHGYLQQIARAADRIGFTGVLIPTGRSCEDAWLVAASMIPVTQRLKFPVALRPSVVSPTVAARQAATLDRLSNGRALFNLVTGSDPQELAGMAFSSIIPNAMKPPQSSPASGDVCWKGKPSPSKGNISTFAMRSSTSRRYSSRALPLFWRIVGRGAGAGGRAGRSLSDSGEPPELVKEKIAQVRAKAAEHGRTVRFGIRLHVIVRETNDEARKPPTV